MKKYKSFILGLLLVTVGGLVAVGHASDHDDGEMDLKGRALNLTDLYVFREDNQTGNSHDKGNLILAMNTNPRSLPRQQYYFSTNANYDFHISRVKAVNKDSTPTGQEDVVLRFQFGEPDDHARQPYRIQAIRSGYSNELTPENLSGQFYTDSLANSDANHLTETHANLFGHQLSIFAGLREDSFFFDVEQFFRVRAGLLGFGPKVGFKPANEAQDFTAGYNVNSIVVRVPIAFLQTGNEEPIFDVWETIDYCSNSSLHKLALGAGSGEGSDAERNGCRQIERLARPVINEGLVVSNANLNAFNMIPPSADLSTAATPVLMEVVKTLTALRSFGGNVAPTPAQVAAGFLPDVMRLDTRVDIPLGKPAYNADLSSEKHILTGGRKIEDDVIDITLSYLIKGDPTGASVKDNVSYEGVPGNPAQPGHRMLHGQTAYNGPATFPFLAKAN